MARLASRLHIAPILACAAFLTACRPTPPPAIDPELAACVAPGANILAGVDCVRLRASPFFKELPAAVAALIEPLRDATYALIASDGKDYALLARGKFHDAPAGATLLTPSLAIAGSPEAVRAATARHRAPGPASALPERAEPLAAANDIWVVVAGNASLPVSGNAENLNRLLHSTEYATLGAHLSETATLNVTAVCATPDAARRLEETLRAMLTLAAGAESRQPEIAARLRAIAITRDDRTVRTGLSITPTDLDQWWR